MSETMRVLIWGAGGHGKVVADVVRACGHEVIGYIDADEDRFGAVAEPGGAKIVCTEEMFRSEPPDFDALALAIGYNTRRLQLVRGLAGDVAMPAFVHPSAEVSPGATIGDATVVAPRVVINAAAKIGAAVILNSACVVEHDCRVGDGVHISPNATLSGNVTVGELAWIGAGATVIEGCEIGPRAIVGAGSTVIRDVEADTTNVGVPTRVTNERRRTT